MEKSIHDNKPIIYRLIRRVAKPALEGRHYPLYAPIPATDEIYDPASDSMRTIRYATGEPSIYKDEQSEKVKLGSIVFQNGKIIVEKRNPNLLLFLELSNHNADNDDRIGNRTTLFRKEDHGKVAKLSVDSILLETQAVNAVLSMKWDKLVAYARVLGIDTDKSSDEVKHDMIVTAKNSPQKFIDGIDDPRTTRKQVVMDCIRYNIITINHRSVKWTIGPENAAILHVPAGREPIEYLAEWTMTEREGEEVFNEMKKRLDKFLSVDKDDDKK